MAKPRSLKGIISADWNGCLAPGGPYDPISFIYPDLTTDLTTIFRKYTGNEISLGEASQRITKLLPAPISAAQIDAYLDRSFPIYKGVTNFIDWCSDNNILFMVNTTGMMGYFQRVLAKGLLPPVTAISANPLIRYPHSETDPHFIFDLFEIQDKSINTGEAMRLFGIPAARVFIMGDSGGDGPHFKWGAAQGSFLIGSMAKASLKKYCEEHGIKINLFFGLSYTRDGEQDPAKEKLVDFRELSRIIEDNLA